MDVLLFGRRWKGDLIALHCLLAFLVGISALMAGVGPFPVSEWGFDVFVLLDAGWRIINGQVPHVDYYSPLGPLYQFLVALGMRIAPTDAALGYAHLGLFLVVSLWAWGIVRTRLPSLFGALCTAFLGLLASVPRPLSQPIEQWGYSMAYNRLGWALAAMLCLSAALPAASPRRGDCRARSVDAISEGALLALLLLLKLSYFLVMLPLAMLLRPVSRAPLRHHAISLGVCLGLAWVGLAAAGIPGGAFLRDMGLVLSAGAGGLPSRLWGQISLDSEALLLLLALAIAVGSARGRGPLPTSAVRPAAVVAVAGLTICAGNSQSGEIPLFPIAGLLLLENARRHRIPGREHDDRAPLALGLVVLTLVLFPITRDLRSLGAARSWQSFAREVPLDRSTAPRRHELEYVRIDAASILGLRFPKRGLGWTSPARYAQTIAEGLELLRANVGPDSRVLAMSGTPNPYSFLLERPSPRGTALFWELGPTRRTIDFLPPKMVFQDVTLVVWERISFRRPSGDPPLTFADRYGDYVRNHYRVRDSSPWWILLERK